MENRKKFVANEMGRFRGGNGATERMYGHLRLAVKELRLVGVSPPDAEMILVHAAQVATYEGNCPWNEWPKRAQD
jgi:hypothetical protein